MTQQKQTTPKWADALAKILAAESRRGHDNRAVIGGLDKSRQRWQAEMTARAAQSPNAPFLLSQNYAEMTPEQRAAWVSQWLQLLNSAAPQPPAPSPQPASPEPVEPRPGRAAPRGLPQPRPAYGVPPAGQNVDAPTAHLKGIDPKTAERLERLDVATVRDLLHLFPRRHDDYSAIVKVAEVTPGQECTVIAQVWESRVVAQGAKGRRKDTEAVLGDETGNIRAIWFGQQYIARTLKPGSRVAISGKAEVFRGQPVFNSPAAYPAESEPASIHTARLVPVYPLTEGLRMAALRNLTWQALQNWLGGVDETLPPTDREGRMSLQEAIFQAHYPDNPEVWQAARSRLAFDELLTLQLAMHSRRRDAQAEIRGVAIPQPAPGSEKDVAGRFLRSLPFDLTAAQTRCIAEIAADMAQPVPPMNRLLQGEVGSGKTVVALAALLSTAAAGFQGALMAPTEVLAEQHFRSTSRLLENRPRQMDGEHLISLSLDGMERDGMERPLSIALLTGSVRAREKRMITAMAADGALDLIFGTQALIQDSVSLPNLALAIADEQHRFGVMQRSALRRRGGENPHTLIMSATPIPRTLSLTLYSDLDISTIDQLPAGRQKVNTRLVAPEKRNAAYDFVRKQVQASRQAFVICPLIDESASIEAKAATEEYDRLSRQVFPDLRVGLLHGRMTPRDKDAILRRFSDGGLDVLVSTAVVEVGIDVPNATIMLIEGAERFGLAQLHQFRGRVGRGQHKSYCLLLPSETETGVGPAAKERLSALTETHDGFRLAEIDLEIRGPGDFFGTRQSGLPALQMARLSDRHLLESARNLATRITAQDPDLTTPQYAPLSAQVTRFTTRSNPPSP